MNALIKSTGDTTKHPHPGTLGKGSQWAPAGRRTRGPPDAARWRRASRTACPLSSTARAHPGRRLLMQRTRRFIRILRCGDRTSCPPSSTACAHPGRRLPTEDMRNEHETILPLDFGLESTRHAPQASAVAPSKGGRGCYSKWHHDMSPHMCCNMFIRVHTFSAR